MTPEDRREKAQAFIESINWDSYDYTKSSGANLDFPDYTGAQMKTLDLWISKHYNSTSRWETCHVRDLNEIPIGSERRWWALYGVPVAWPDKQEDSEAAEEVIDLLTEAMAEGGDEFARHLSEHGMVNEEHFRWMRARHFGMPDDLQSDDAAERALKEIDAAKAEDAQSYENALDGFEIKDEVHLHYIRNQAALSKRQAYVGAQKILDQTQAMLQKKFESNKQKLSGDLAPYKGISMEVWAGATARLAQGQSIENIIESIGIDMPLWEDVSAEWNTRMSRDTTATIATVFGQAFVGGGQGQFGAAGQATAQAMNTNRGTNPNGEDPVSFEEWIKITEHMSAASFQGIEADEVLSNYSMNAADWGTVGGYWAQKFNANAMDYLDDYQRLSDKYRAQFASS